MTPYYEQAGIRVVHGDSFDVLLQLVAESIDACVTGQHGFQAWCEAWALEVLRVLKPGGYLLACGAPRSGHRLASGIEDAGFEIRDSIAWLCGQGFPKSKNLGDGRGTALKPGFEPIIVARKPFSGSVTANVAQHGTGGLNIDACRLHASERPNLEPDRGRFTGNAWRGGIDGSLCGSRANGTTDLGRWPANVVLDETTAAELDRQVGDRPSGAAPDHGGPSRFFYCAKPSRAERDLGCEGLSARTPGECTDRKEGSAGLNSPRAGAGRTGGAIQFPAMEASWVKEALARVVQTASRSQRLKATGEYTTPELRDSAWNTCWCGSPSTDLFHPAIKSTIETATSWTTGSRISSWSTRPHTNGCIAAALGEMVVGGSLASSVKNPSPWMPSTGISAEKDGSSTADADRATSVASWLTSKPGEGGGRRMGVRNFHPT